MSLNTLSPRRRSEILDALRRGTVPQDGLDVLAVGLARFQDAMDQELAKISEGGSGFKAVRGEYGCGKTFFSRWLQERARSHNLATTEVQVSETETPLHKLETVYRRMTERLSTASTRSSSSSKRRGFFRLRSETPAATTMLRPFSRVIPPMKI